MAPQQPAAVQQSWRDRQGARGRRNRALTGGDESRARAISSCRPSLPDCRTATKSCRPDLCADPLRDAVQDMGRHGMQNAVPQGLSSSIFTQDLRAARTVPQLGWLGLRHRHVKSAPAAPRSRCIRGEKDPAVVANRVRMPGRCTCADRPTPSPTPTRCAGQGTASTCKLCPAPFAINRGISETDQDVTADSGACYVPAPARDTADQYAGNHQPGCRPAWLDTRSFPGQHRRDHHRHKDPRGKSPAIRTPWTGDGLAIVGPGARLGDIILSVLAVIAVILFFGGSPVLLGWLGMTGNLN